MECVTLQLGMNLEMEFDCRTKQVISLCLCQMDWQSVQSVNWRSLCGVSLR